MKKYINHWRRSQTPVLPQYEQCDRRYPGEPYLDNLLDRTIDHIKRSLGMAGTVIVHLFEARPGDRQCNNFNKRLRDRFYTELRDGRLIFIEVDPEDWGFEPKGVSRR